MGKSPRQERARATRDRILAATAEIARAQGAAAVTTTALAQDLGMSVGTVYRYFATREAAIGEAYDDVYARVIRRWLESLGDLSDLPEAEAARILMDRYLAASAQDASFLPLLQGIRETRSLGEERDRPGMPPDRLARFAGLLGIELTPDNRERMHLMRHLTSELSHLQLLSETPRREIVYEETIRIIAQFIARMRPPRPPEQGG